MAKKGLALLAAAVGLAACAAAPDVSASPRVEINVADDPWPVGENRSIVLRFLNNSTRSFEFRAGSACAEPVAWIEGPGIPSSGAVLHAHSGPESCAAESWDAQVPAQATIERTVVWNGSSNPADSSAPLVSPGSYTIHADISGSSKSWDVASTRLIRLT